MKRRPIVILTVSFVVMLAAGVALAQVGAFAPGFSELAEESNSLASDSEFLPHLPDPDAPERTKPVMEEQTLKEDPLAKEAPKEEPDKPAVPAGEPKEGPADKPADKPADTTPPKLTITSPADGAHFGEKKLTYTGVTEPGARVFAGEWEADVLKDGEWHIVLVLSAGKNITTFTAKDPAGNRTKATVAVYLDAADVSDQPFTAHQKYGTSSEPREKFYGTAAPGTKIELISKYGNARMVTEGREWYLKLHFDGLKEAATVPVVLETSTGKRMEFTFNYRPKAVEFSAHQMFGTSSEPWEKLYGTAPLGTVIEVGSINGNARMVTESYEWHLKLHFEGLTQAATFPIKLHSSTGKVMEFMFTYEPKAIEFTAKQKYGSCSELEPYDVFLGTARPGSEITAATEGHGSATTVAGDYGQWDLKLFFTNTTPGEPFAVTVSDSDGHTKMFTFVSYAGGGK
jgi:hypothetical protein